jgi:hypothetical protein
MLTVFIMNILTLSVITISVHYAEFCNTEGHSVKCPFAESHYSDAFTLSFNTLNVHILSDIMPIVITLNAITLSSGTLCVFVTLSAGTLCVFMTLSAGTLGVFMTLRAVSL